MSIMQRYRQVAVSSPLGEDKFLFRRMTATEQVGRLSCFDLELLSADHEIPLDDVLGQNMTVRLILPQWGEPRYFNGFVSHFSYGGIAGDYAVYRAQLRPWLWFLTRTADSRIFQEMAVPDIVAQIFGDQGFTDFEQRLSGSYRTWEYCVQYRETDFNFVSRLMELEGVYYYFRHEGDKHTLVMSDSIGSHESFTGYEEVPYYPPDDAGIRERDHVSHWTVYQDVQAGSYTLRDFDFKRPKADLTAKLSNPGKHPHGEMEIYDYPGAYVENSDGDNYARIRLEELNSQYEKMEGSGDVAGLRSGALFKLTNYPRDDQNREYLVLATETELTSDDYVSNSGAPSEPVLKCNFTALDRLRPYRAPRLTPKPVVQGPQTAIVTGPAGEEIWPDENGRVKVQFHWDREGQYDENSSCWVRVSQPWAGKGWGSVSIPRVGQEVIVDFIEGDPDRPIITGRVYNGDCKPPYALPAGAVTSGLKSNSTPGGGGYNEMSMDDTKGKEKITIHGQYDMATTIEHDQTNKVVNHRTTTVESGNDTLAVATGTRAVTVKGNSSHTVQAGSRAVTVSGGDYAARAEKAIVLYGKTTGVNITGDTEGVAITGNGKGVGIAGNGEGVSITGNGDGVGITGNGTGVEIIGNGEGVTITGNPEIYAEGSSEVTLKGPKVSIGEGEVNITGKKIVLSVGGSSITVDSAGVTIQGTLAKLN